MSIYISICGSSFKSLKKQIFRNGESISIYIVSTPSVHTEYKMSICIYIHIYYQDQNKPQHLTIYTTQNQNKPYHLTIRQGCVQVHTTNQHSVPSRIPWLPTPQLVTCKHNGVNYLCYNKANSINKTCLLN